MPLDSGVQGCQSMDIGIITYAWSPEFPEWMSAIGESWISAEPPLEILFRQSTWKPGGQYSVMKLWATQTWVTVAKWNLELVWNVLRTLWPPNYAIIFYCTCTQTWAEAQTYD